MLGLSSVASLVFERIDGARRASKTSLGAYEPTFDVAPGRLNCRRPRVLRRAPKPRPRGRRVMVLSALVARTWRENFSSSQRSSS